MFLNFSAVDPFAIYSINVAIDFSFIVLYFPSSGGKNTAVANYKELVTSLFACLNIKQELNHGVRAL